MFQLLKLIKQTFSGTGYLLPVSIFFAVIAAFDGVVYPYFFGEFTDILTAKHYHQIWPVIILWTLSLISITLAGMFFNYFLGKTRQKVNISLKDRIFKKAYTRGNERVPASEYINTILQDVKQIETQFVNSAVNFIYCILQGMIACILVLSINWKVGLVFICLGFIPSLVPKASEKWLKNGTKTWQSSNQVYTDSLKEGLQSRKLIQRYQATSNIFKRLFLKLTKQEQAYFTMNFRQSVSKFGVNSLYYLTTMIGLAYGVYTVIKGDLSVGELITIYMAADRVTNPLVSGFTYYSWMIGTAPLVTNIWSNEVRDAIPSSPIISPLSEYLVNLEDLSVGYNKKSIIENINLQIIQGDRILIQGPSGAGKSTLMKTIMNEIEPTSGKLIFGGKLSNNLTSHFAVVEQRPFLFHDTLKFNLTLGQTIDENKLITVLENVGLNHLANKQALNTMYSEDKNPLSGGEMKRLEVARAILYGKEILVVDEALSGLDEATAKHLNTLIMNYPGTVIDIEHHIKPELVDKFTKKLYMGK